MNIKFTEDVWLEMSAKCNHNYFASWGWISIWLSSLPAKNDIHLIVGYLDNSPVVVFIAGRRNGLRYGFLPSKTFSLNSTEDSHFDQLFIEYNKILMIPSLSIKITDILGSIGSWNEFILPEVSSEFVSCINLLEGDGHEFFLIVDKYENSYSLDFQKVRDASMDFFGLLSSNRRSQIHRSVKQYKLGRKVRVREAGTWDSALSMFDDLVSLHQREWKKRNRPGAFSKRYFHGFHRELIRKRFEDGEIQLLQIYNQNSLIVYLYDFVYGRNILFYQSGFNYVEENIYRPGPVSHYLGILHNAEKGLSLYDFLARESQYKISLSTRTFASSSVTPAPSASLRECEADVAGGARGERWLRSKLGFLSVIGALLRRFCRQAKVVSTNTAPMYWTQLIKNKNRFYFKNRLLNAKQKLASSPGIIERLKQFKYWLDSKQ